MCNLVIKLQVSFQFPWRYSQWPLQEPQQHQGSLQGQRPQQHQQAPTQPNPAGAAVQQQPAGQPACSRNPGGSASLRPDDLSSTAQQRSAEAEVEASQQPATGHWRHHAYSMAAAPSHQQRLGPHWQRWPHHSGGAAHLPHQDPCSLPSLDAESAPTGHEVHRQAQMPTATCPSSLWGFAASGVDLGQHPAASEQAQLQELTWQGPAQLGQAGASLDDESLTVPDSLSHAMPLSRPKSALCSSASGQESTSGRHENKQLGAQQAVQDEEDQWMIVDHDGRREQQGRWAPAKIVRHMMSRARRHRAESPSLNGRVSAQTNLADTASAST